MEQQKRTLTLQDVALTVEQGAPAYTTHGYVVDGDARIHALTERFFHGVITALLYPEKAQQHGIGVPCAPIDEIDVYAYQAFEHEVASGLPLLRVATSLLTNSHFVSKGRKPATPAQIDALARVFKAMGLRGNDTLTGEDGDPTVAQYLEQLRNEKEPSDAEQDYTLIPPEASV